MSRRRRQEFFGAYSSHKAWHYLRRDQYNARLLAIHNQWVPPDPPDRMLSTERMEALEANYRTLRGPMTKVLTAKQ